MDMFQVLHRNVHFFRKTSDENNFEMEVDQDVWLSCVLDVLPLFDLDLVTDLDLGSCLDDFGLSGFDRCLHHDLFRLGLCLCRIDHDHVPRTLLQLVVVVQGSLDEMLGPGLEVLAD